MHIKINAIEHLLANEAIQYNRLWSFMFDKVQAAGMQFRITPASDINRLFTVMNIL